MKSFILYALTATLALSCESNSEFDLADLKLGFDKVNAVVPKDAKQKTFKLGENGDSEYVMIRSEQLLNFNQTPLSGTLNPDSGQGENGISLYYKATDSIIDKYNITIFTREEGERLLVALKEKLGEPDFYSYKSPEDKTKNQFRALLWEDQNNNRLYRLNYGLNGTVKATLDVTENTLAIETLNLIPPFSYWEDYLKARKTKNNNYTYQQFIVDETKQNPDNFYQALTK